MNNAFWGTVVMKKFAFKALLASVAALPAATPALAQDAPINGNIILSSPSPGSTYFRDIKLTDTRGGLRFYGAPSLDNTPDGAALQFFGNQTSFPGQAYIDAGAIDTGAIIL